MSPAQHIQTKPRLLFIRRCFKPSASEKENKVAEVELKVEATLGEIVAVPRL